MVDISLGVKRYKWKKLLEKKKKMKRKWAT